MRILIIDDDEALCRSLQIHLQRAGNQVEIVHSGASGLESLQSAGMDLVFVDLDLPDTTGMDILQEMKTTNCSTIPVMITGVQDAKSTIDAIRFGAFDFIRKPLDLDTVMLTLEKVKQHRLQSESKATEPVSAPSEHKPHEIIGSHPTVIEMLKQIALVAESGVPVLIQGESGTGKELVARALHRTGHSDKPFVAVNCSAVVPTLLESELFGHVKGAFTSADADKVGKLESAGEGTIFFDEIGDMGFDLQAKLLRVLQEKEFERVGSTRSVKFGGRVVAATHRNLRAMVSDGKFREDLFYRIAVSTILVPPLRERRTDIPALVEYMLAHIAQELHKPIDGIDRGALRRCTDYDWPGNVRELNNVLTRSVLLARGPLITEQLIMNAMGNSMPVVTASPGIQTLRNAEKDHVHKALLANDWNIKRTSEILDISRVTLRKKIEDYGLSRPESMHTEH